MAALSTLVDRVRLEIGDASKSFVTRFIADGTTNRFKLQYAPVEALTARIFIEDGINPATEITDNCTVEEATGILITDTVISSGTTIIVSGDYFRYFTTPEIEGFITDALDQHTARRKDSIGRKVTVESLPSVEEYVLAVYASTLALYVLATDSAFDIDIQAPDGVTIPRAQRYRQLMEMVQTRKEQYRELCMQLGIGLFGIEVFSLRRISKRTNRYVPVYEAQEVYDRSMPTAADLPTPTYGDVPVPWPTEAQEFLAYQGLVFSDTVSFTGDFTGESFVARLVTQRGSEVVIQSFDLSVIETSTNEYTASLSLSKDQTLRLPTRCWWTLQRVNDETGDMNEIKGGNFFTERTREVIVT